jgi:hypothetical protein
MAPMPDVPNLEYDDQIEWGEEASLAGEAIDALGPDVCSRMIRGSGVGAYEAGDEDDSHDLGDWLPGGTNVARARHSRWR